MNNSWTQEFSSSEILESVRNDLFMERHSYLLREAFCNKPTIITFIQAF